MANVNVSYFVQAMPQFTQADKGRKYFSLCKCYVCQRTILPVNSLSVSDNNSSTLCKNYSSFPTVSF